MTKMEIWRQVKNPQGKIYYVNIKSYQRSWSEPVGDNIKIFGFKDQVITSKNPESVTPIKEETKDLRWRISEKIYNELVRSQTWYWVAFAGASGYLGYIIFFSQ